MDKKSKVFRLVLSGVMIAASFVLSFIKINWLPFGGSVTLFSMVPVIFVSCMYGTKWGLLTAGTYSILQLIQSVATSSSFILDSAWQTILMILLDFILAFTVLGFAGIFVTKKSSPKSIGVRCALGAFLVTLLRYICHIGSGFILWGEYASWFFTDEFNNALGSWAMNTLNGNALALMYSTVYNGLYMIPEIIISTMGILVITSIPFIKKRIMSSKTL